MKTIELSQGKVALVDDEDFELLSMWKWCASLESRGTKWYAIRWQGPRSRRVKIRMHCLVLGRPPLPTDGMVVNHIDDNSLNNQKSNLEIITQEQNMKLSKGWTKNRKEVWL